VLTGKIAGFYLRASGAEEFDVGTAEDYWEAGGEASLSGRVREKGFWGVAYRLSRRQTDPSDDDYFLQVGDLFFRQRFLSWLSGRISYSHERRNYDLTSRFDEYHENRLGISLNVIL
jgi:hypothetical protein